MQENSSGADLVALILSMDGSERRYFRLFAGQGKQSGEKGFLKLYDHLIASGQWSEEAIQNTFAGEAFLKQLNVVRTRLQQMILDALRSYDHGKTFQLDFSRRLDEIEILFRRKLLSPCRRAVKATLRKAQLLELPIQELSALVWALRIERHFGGVDLSSRMERFNQRHREVAQQILLESELLVAHNSMEALLPQHAVSDINSKEAANAIMRLSVMQTPPHAIAFDAKLMLYYIHAYHALIHDNKTAFLQQYEQVVQVWELSAERMRLEEERYFKTLLGYAESAANANEEATTLKAIGKLKRILERSTVLRPVENVRILKIELQHLVATMKWGEAQALETKIRHSLDEYGTSITSSNRLNLVSNLIIALFIGERWKAVLEWADQLEVEAGTKTAEQWQWLGRAVRWVAWYESGALESLEKSITPLLKTSKTVVADPLAAAYAALLHSNNVAQEVQAFEALHDTILAQQTQANLPHLDLLRVWVHARIKGISFEEAAM